MSEPVIQAGTPSVLEGNSETLSAVDASASLSACSWSVVAGLQGCLEAERAGSFHEESTSCLMTVRMRQGCGEESSC